MAVTAPVCPRKTDIGKPSGKRHYENQIVKYKTLKNPKEKGEKIQKNCWLHHMKAYNSNNTVIWWGCN